MEIFVRVIITPAAVTVEEMTGTGMMIKKTRGTAVFHQEAISVQKIVMAMLTARQEYSYPITTNPAMVPVTAVQGSRVTTVSMTAWLDLMKSQSNKMRPTLISTRTYKTALMVVPQV